MIELFQQDPDLGLLMVANGIDTVMVWDGFSDGFVLAGLIAPVAKITVGGSGSGAIVGRYYAFQRFLDALGNVSNLSPVSDFYDVAGTSGSISGATATSPIVITSTAHGLITGDFVNIEKVGGIFSANNVWQITVVDADNFSLDNSASDGISTYTGGGTWISGVSSINYTNVEKPVDPKVVRRQILRNADGEATVFYVDVDTEDLSATSFTSSLIDTLLTAGIAVPLLDATQFPFADANDPPPNFFKCIAQQLDRMFLAGLLEYNLGSASVASGSTTVVGAGTDWKRSMAGRFLYVDGASRTYEIATVDELNQTLTLTDAYSDSTDLFAFYSIKTPPAYRRVVQFSQAGSSQSWPAFNAFSIQETSDEITALLQMGSYIYIVEKAHIHKMTFADNPLTDGAVFMTANRGAVNQRCIIVVDSAAYMLDELGVHRFKGNSEVEPLSVAIQTIFRNDEDSKYRINWRQKEYFHAVLERQRETIRWFVCLDGSRHPRHAICLQYRTNRWWIEEYPLCVGGTATGYLGGFAGSPQVYYGSEFAKVLAAWSGPADLVDAGEGSIRSSLTSGSCLGAADSRISWPSQGIVNAPVSIVHGKGKGQIRRIVNVSGQTLSVDMPWLIRPDNTSIYQIGGIKWLFRSSWMRLSASEAVAQRRFEMLFEPMTSESGGTTADLRFFSDFTGNADIQAVTTKSDDGGGIESVEGEPDLTLDLTKQNGLIDRQLPSGREYFIQGRRYMQFEIEGASNDDQVRLFEFSYEGVVDPSQGKN